MTDIVTETTINDRKLFKITNREENHFGFQYESGLNVLDEPFAETGSCCPGGFYFTTVDHIHDFLSYGIYLREIKLPVTDPNFKIAKDSRYCKKWRVNKIILGQRWLLSDPASLKYLIDNGMDILPAIKLACNYEHAKILKFLVENNVSCKFFVNNLLIAALQNKSWKAIKLLIESGADVSVENNLALRLASEYGYSELVELLIENGVDIDVSGDEAICLAFNNGHTKIVVILEKSAGAFYEISCGKKIYGVCTAMSAEVTIKKIFSKFSRANEFDIEPKTFVCRKTDQKNTDNPTFVYKCENFFSPNGSIKTRITLESVQ